MRSLLAALSLCLMAGISGNPTWASAQSAPSVVKFNRPQQGIASLYWEGVHTANGERVNPRALTAAHRTLPFNTVVKVTNNRNSKIVFVRINDRAGRSCVAGSSI